MLINGYLLYNRVIKNEVGMSVMNLSKIIESAKEVFEIEANSILRLKDNIGEEFDRAIDILYNCKGRVIVTGMGKSGLIGKKIAATMSSTGTPAYFLHPAESTHGDSGVITRNDVIIAISNSGETQELMNLLPLIKRFGCEMIGMTGNLNSTLAKTSEVVLDISVEKEACPLGKAPTASTTATLAMGDALAVALMEKRNFRPQDFAHFHPGGELGKRLLTTAQDVMRQDDLPILPPEMHLGEAVILISKGKLGLGVAERDGQLLGIVTDGDIRRAMEKWQAEFFNRTVNDIMTIAPKTVSPETKISDIQRIMHKHKIHSVLVVDKSHKLLGVVDSYSCMI